MFLFSFEFIYKENKVIKKTELQAKKEKSLYVLLDSFEISGHLDLGNFLNVFEYLNQEQLLDVYKNPRTVGVLKHLCEKEYMQSVFYIPFLKNATINQENFADFLFIIKKLEPEILKKHPEIQKKEFECFMCLKKHNEQLKAKMPTNNKKDIEEKIVSSLDEIGFFSEHNVGIMLKNLDDIENVQQYIIDLFSEEQTTNGISVKFSVEKTKKYREIIQKVVILNQEEKEIVSLALIAKSINAIIHDYLNYRSRFSSMNKRIILDVINIVLSKTPKAKQIKDRLNLSEFNNVCFYELKQGSSEFNENTIGYARVLIENDISMKGVNLFSEYIVSNMFTENDPLRQKIFAKLFDFKNRKVLSHLLENERLTFFSLLSHYAKETGLYDLNKKINNVESITFSNYFTQNNVLKILNFLYYFYVIGQEDFNNKFNPESKINVRSMLENNYRVLGIFNDDGYEMLNILFSRYEEKYGKITDFNKVNKKQLLEILNEVEVNFVLDKGRIYSRSIIDIKRLLTSIRSCSISVCNKINDYLELCLGNDYLYKYYKNPYSFGASYSCGEVILLNLIIAIRTGDFSLFKAFGDEKIKLDYDQKTVDMIMDGADIENNKISDETILVFSLSIKDYLEIISKIELIKSLNDSNVLNYYINYLGLCVVDTIETKEAFLVENPEYNSEFYHVRLDYYFGKK